MRIAYQIGLHGKEQQFKWLFDAIYSPDDLFDIHVDRKAPEATWRAVQAIVGDRPNVHFNRRHSVIYGDWKLCEVELDGIRYFLEHHRDWQYFINLSGQDYPLKTRDEIVAELGRDPTRNYIDVIPLDALPPYFRRRKHWFCFRIGDRFIRTPIPLIQPKHFRVDWHGSAWHILTRDFCQWLVSAELARDCMAFLHHVKLSNELLMQTLIMNGPFRETLERDYKRKIFWLDHTPHPQTVRMKDYDALLASGAFFARKFDQTVDSAILHALARRLGIEAEATGSAAPQAVRP